MAYSPSRGILYTEPPEPDRQRDDPTAETSTDQSPTPESAADQSPTPADD